MIQLGIDPQSEACLVTVQEHYRDRSRISALLTTTMLAMNRGGYQGLKGFNPVGDHD